MHLKSYTLLKVHIFMSKTGTKPYSSYCRKTVPANGNWLSTISRKGCTEKNCMYNGVMANLFAGSKSNCSTVRDLKTLTHSFTYQMNDLTAKGFFQN